MKVTSIKTAKVKTNDDLFLILDQALPNLAEGSVVVITSKIVALCEGRVASFDVTRDQLVEREADYYLPRENNPYNFCLSIKDHTLIASAGIDRSNSDGQWVLWPTDSQNSANQIRAYLSKKHQLKKIGVIITDSHVLPLRRGVLGTALAHSGFLPLNNYVGKKDIYGQEMKVSMSNISEGLASAAVVVMGEGNEQTPVAVINDVDFVQFQDRDPNEQELNLVNIDLQEDLYAPILTKADWKSSSASED